MASKKQRKTRRVQDLRSKTLSASRAKGVKGGQGTTTAKKKMPTAVE